MAEDLSYSDMVLNSQLETKMEQNTQIFRNLVSKHPYLKKKKIWRTLFVSIFYWGA